MKFKSKEEFYIIETIKDDGQYLCEYLTNQDTRELHIHDTTRNVHDKRIKKFENLEMAEGVRLGLKNSLHADEPRIMKVSLELSIEEAQCV